MSANRPPLRCNGCHRIPDNIPIYVTLAREEELTTPDGTPDADEYVWREEGTLNRDNGHFLCDQCYINAGMPSGPGGWKAP
jgi:hypothetical protein